MGISSSLIQLFAKAPIAGRVKTRLIADLGAERSLNVYLHCLEHNLTLLRDSGLDYQLWLDQPSDHPLFDREIIHCQQGNDLGEKMLYAMTQALEDQRSQFQRVILIGSDCLDITIELLQEVIHQLNQHPLVIVPALDGGYVLIAANKTINARLFDHIDWSTDRVLQQTLMSCQQLRLQPFIFNPLRDIDHLADMKHYAALQQYL